MEKEHSNKYLPEILSEASRVPFGRHTRDPRPVENPLEMILTLFKPTKISLSLTYTV